MDASLRHLQALYPAFMRYCLSASDTVPTSSEDETIELPQLLCPIIDFTASVVRGGKAKAWLDGGNLERLVTAVFEFAQMTDDDVRFCVR